jgi:hypothetical protein
VNVFFCACHVCKSCHAKPQGETALEKFPHIEAAIRRVQTEQSFLIEDLGWICATMEKSIRLTIANEAYECIKHAEPDLPNDMVFGSTFGSVHAHLLFSWEGAAEGEARQFGHFDLLSPSPPCIFNMMLVPDDSQLYIL